MDEKNKNEFLELIEKPYIKRISFLGGECLADENLEEVYDLIKNVKKYIQKRYFGCIQVIHGKQFFIQL